MGRIGGEAEASRLGDVGTLKVALALMLVLTHGVTVLHGVSGSLTHMAPAVPVFLFLSGYFMLANYKRSPRPLRFIAGRYLKLLPIMVVSLITMVGLLLIVGGWPLPGQVIAELPLFVVTHLTVFQAYVPPGFETLNGRVMNGPLWFLGAILILYATLPLIARTERTVKHAIAVPFLASVVCVLVLPGVVHRAGGITEAIEAATGTALKGVVPSLVEHVFYLGYMVAVSGWMFYAGCLSRRYQSALFTARTAYALMAASLVVTLLLFAVGLGRWNFNGIIAPWYFPGYVAFWIVLHIAWLERLSVPAISIGLYVFHIPVFLALDHLGLGQLWIALPVVVGLSLVSLYLAERPMAALLGRLTARWDRGG
jgi:peptidoglycan/LPS O-acetylase OafA/YrhL